MTRILTFESKTSNPITVELLSYEQISALLDYDSETGKLFWKHRSRSLFKSEQSFKAWNKRFATQEAITSYDSSGYRHGQILGRNYRAHRLIWILHYGEWPQLHIDHINGDPSDNRIVNLRSVSQSTNMRNARRPVRNNSGVVGVCWDASRGQWLCQMQVNGRRVRIGRFDHFDDAVAARKSAEEKYGFHENHGRSA